MVRVSIVGQYEVKELIIMYASAEDPQIVQRIEKYLGEIDNYLGLHKVLTLISTEREQFLTRIESCLYLKMVANSDVYDPLAQELLELYTCYKQSGGFAVIGRGLRVVVSTRLMDFETVLSQHEKWLNQPQAFEDVFKAYHDEVVKRPRCHHFYIPIVVSNIPEYIKCAKCSRYMKSAVTLECCHGDQPMRPSYPTPSLEPPGFPDSAATPPEPRAQPSAVAAEPQVPAANQNGVPAATGPTTYPSQSRVPSALDEWTPRSHLGAV